MSLHQVDIRYRNDAVLGPPNSQRPLQLAQVVPWQADHGRSHPQLPSNLTNTVDGSEIPNNHLGCQKNL